MTQTRSQVFYHKHRDEILEKRRNKKKTNPEYFKEQSRLYRERHPDRVKASNKKWQESDPESFKERTRQRAQRWKERHSEEVIEYRRRDETKQWHREWHRKKRLADPQFAMKCRLRSRLYTALKYQGIKRSISTFELVGCSHEQLLEYLENLFMPRMSWENRSEWHIDHIKPCADFDLTDIEQQKICFHWTNLQPLWKRDNLRKGRKTVSQ